MKLTETELQQIANSMSNSWYHWNIRATKELTELFDEIARNPLNTWQEYVKMYDNSFYTYKTFEDLVESEKDQSDGLTEEECKEQINKSIWQLPCGWYVQYI